MLQATAVSLSRHHTVNKALFILYDIYLLELFCLLNASNAGTLLLERLKLQPIGDDMVFYQPYSRVMVCSQA